MLSRPATGGSEQMRIVLSNASSRWGGVHKVTEILARGFLDRGHGVTVFGFPGGMLEQRMNGVAPFEPILSGMDFHPRVVWRAGRALRRHRAEIVLAMMKKDVRQTALAAHALGIPVVVRHANQQALGRGQYVRALYGHVTAMHVANAEATRRTLVESAPWLPAGKIRVIYNGVDPAPFAGATPLHLGVPAGSTVIGYVGSFEARKGVLELARAWRQVAGEKPDAYLVLCGKGKLEARMRSLLEGVPRVVWLGYRTDVPNVMRSLDMLVLPSYVEGAPNVVLEAMSAGVAVVATDVSGTPELARDGVEARLVPPRDVDALALGMIELASDPVLRARMVSLAKRRVAECFTIPRMIDEYLELFGEILAARSISGRRD